MKAHWLLLTALFCCLAWALPAPAQTRQGVRGGVCLDQEDVFSAAIWQAGSDAACSSPRVLSMCWSNAARYLRSTPIFSMICPRAAAPSFGSAAVWASVALLSKISATPIPA